MDPNRIFGLFDNSNTPEEHPSADIVLLDDITKLPVYWVGMFKKLIHNHRNFNKKVAGYLAKMDDELNVYDVEVAGEFVVYNRAWYWLSKIDITQIKHQDALIQYTDEYLTTYLQFSISYWEEYEEYEKCAFLKHIYDFCMKSSS